MTTNGTTTAPRLPRRDLGTRVEIVKAGSDNGRTGTVVAGSVWTANVAEGRDHGDRTVRMDDTGERLVFEVWMMTDTDTPDPVDPTPPAFTAAEARSIVANLRRMTDDDLLDVRDRAARVIDRTRFTRDKVRATRVHESVMAERDRRRDW